MKTILPIFTICFLLTCPLHALAPQSEFSPGRRLGSAEYRALLPARINAVLDTKGLPAGDPLRSLLYQMTEDIYPARYMDDEIHSEVKAGAELEGFITAVENAVMQICLFCSDELEQCSGLQGSDILNKKNARVQALLTSLNNLRSVFVSDYSRAANVFEIPVMTYAFNQSLEWLCRTPALMTQAGDEGTDFNRFAIFYLVGSARTLNSRTFPPGTDLKAAQKAVNELVTGSYRSLALLEVLPKFKDRGDIDETRISLAESLREDCWRLMKDSAIPVPVRVILSNIYASVFVGGEEGRIESIPKDTPLERLLALVEKTFNSNPQAFHIFFDKPVARPLPDISALSQNMPQESLRPDQQEEYFGKTLKFLYDNSPPVRQCLDDLNVSSDEIPLTGNRSRLNNLAATLDHQCLGLLHPGAVTDPRLRLTLENFLKITRGYDLDRPGLGPTRFMHAMMNHLNRYHNRVSAELKARIKREARELSPDVDSLFYGVKGAMIRLRNKWAPEFGQYAVLHLLMDHPAVLDCLENQKTDEELVSAMQESCISALQAKLPADADQTDTRMYAESRETLMELFEEVFLRYPDNDFPAKQLAQMLKEAHERIGLRYYTGDAGRLLSLPDVEGPSFTSQTLLRPGISENAGLYREAFEAILASEAVLAGLDKTAVKRQSTVPLRSQEDIKELAIAVRDSCEAAITRISSSSPRVTELITRLHAAVFLDDAKTPIDLDSQAIEPNSRIHLMINALNRIKQASYETHPAAYEAWLKKNQLHQPHITEGELEYDIDLTALAASAETSAAIPASAAEPEEILSGIVDITPRRTPGGELPAVSNEVPLLQMMRAVSESRFQRMRFILSLLGRWIDRILVGPESSVSPQPGPAQGADNFTAAADQILSRIDAILGNPLVVHYTDGVPDMAPVEGMLQETLTDLAEESKVIEQGGALNLIDDAMQARLKALKALIEQQKTLGAQRQIELAYVSKGVGKAVYELRVIDGEILLDGLTLGKKSGLEHLALGLPIYPSNIPDDNERQLQWLTNCIALIHESRVNEKIKSYIDQAESNREADPVEADRCSHFTVPVLNAPGLFQVMVYLEGTDVIDLENLFQLINLTKYLLSDYEQLVAAGESAESISGRTGTWIPKIQAFLNEPVCRSYSDNQLHEICSAVLRQISLPVDENTPAAIEELKGKMDLIHNKALTEAVEIYTAQYNNLLVMHHALIVHGDVKPGNFRGTNPIDFGYSCILSEGQTSHPDGKIWMGTLSCMSALQFSTFSRGPSTDLISHALVWFEALGGNNFWGMFLNEMFSQCRLVTAANVSNRNEFFRIFEAFIRGDMPDTDRQKKARLLVSLETRVAFIRLYKFFGYCQISQLTDETRDYIAKLRSDPDHASMGTILQYIVQGMSQNPDLQYMTVQDYIGSVFAQMINGLEHLHNAQNAEDSPYNTFGLYLRHFLSATSNMVMENTNGYRHYLSRQLGLIQTPVQGEEPARYVRVAYDMWKGNNTGDPSVEDILVTLNIIRESGADIHALVRASMVLESPASTADSESYRTYYSAVSSAVVKAFSGIRAASGTISVDESASSQRLVAGAA